jgi:hypothetical protein
MNARSYLLILAFGASCAAASRHADVGNAPDSWITTLDQPSRRLVTGPTSIPNPRPTSREGCTLFQKLAMHLSGITEDQIRKTCE